MDAAFQRFMAELPTRQDLSGVQSLLERALGSYGFHMFAYLSFVPGETSAEILPGIDLVQLWVREEDTDRASEVLRSYLDLVEESDAGTEDLDDGSLKN